MRLLPPQRDYFGIKADGGADEPVWDHGHLRVAVNRDRMEMENSGDLASSEGPGDRRGGYGRSVLGLMLTGWSFTKQVRGWRSGNRGGLTVLCRVGHDDPEPATAVLGWSSLYGTGDVKQFDSFLPPCPMPGWSVRSGHECPQSR